jgi:hypothetical protein
MSDDPTRTTEIDDAIVFKRGYTPPPGDPREGKGYVAPPEKPTPPPKTPPPSSPGPSKGG